MNYINCQIISSHNLVKWQLLALLLGQTLMISHLGSRGGLAYFTTVTVVQQYSGMHDSLLPTITLMINIGEFREI